MRIIDRKTLLMTAASVVLSAGVWVATTAVAKDTCVVTIDAPKGVSGDFGTSVAVSADGSVVFVGSSNGDTGDVHAFRRTDYGDWQETARLTAYPTGAMASSADGSTLVASDAAAEKVYAFTGDDWSKTQVLTAQDATGSSGFGYSVAVNPAGTTAVVGAPFNEKGSGSAFVWERTGNNGGEWTRTAWLTGYDPASSDQFGRAVASGGSTVAVGAPLADGGRVSTYRCEGKLCVLTGLLKPSNPKDTNFGQAVAMSRDGLVAAVGAPGNDDNPGAVYVFRQEGDDWVMAQRIAAPDAKTLSFGEKVSMSGDSELGVVSNQTVLRTFTGPKWTLSGTLTAQDVRDLSSSSLGFAIATGATVEMVTDAAFCPVEDGDGDGVPDDVDACPDRIGGDTDFDGDGCADSRDQVAEVVSDMMKASYFAVAKELAEQAKGAKGKAKATALFDATRLAVAAAFAFGPPQQPSAVGRFEAGQDLKAFKRLSKSVKALSKIKSVDTLDAARTAMEAGRAMLLTNAAEAAVELGDDDAGVVAARAAADNGDPAEHGTIEITLIVVFSEGAN